MILILSDVITGKEDYLNNLLLKVGITEYKLWYEDNVGSKDAKCVVDMRSEKPFTTRGTVSIDPLGVPYIQTFSLKELSKSHWYLPVLLHDLAKAKKIEQEGFKKFEYQVEVTGEPSKLDLFLKLASDLNLPVSFDIETSLHGGERIKCIGFSYCPDFALVVKTENLDPRTYFELIDVLKKWMTGTNIRWIGQNGYGFDINYILRQWKFEITNYVFDTMVAHHVLHPEFPHDLAFLTSMYTDIPYYKDTADKDLYNYNGLDCISTLICYQEMKKELESRGLLDIYNKYYHRLLTPFREMSLRGISIDTEYQKELKSDLKKEIKELQGRINEGYAGTTSIEGLERRVQRCTSLLDGKRKTVFLRGKRKRLSSLITSTKKLIQKKKQLNVRSPKEMSTFLYKTLGLKPKKSKGKITTNESAINQLFIETGNPILKDMIKLRQLEKCMSDYGMMKTDSDDKVRTVYKFVETGRLSSGKFEAK